MCVGARPAVASAIRDAIPLTLAAMSSLTKPNRYDRSRRAGGRCVLAIFALLAASLSRADPVHAQTPRSDTTSASRIEDVARRVMEGAKYATFVTLDATGAPRSRTVQPQPPDSAFTVWFATNPRTRKVVDVAHDGRVVLHYFDPALSGYVSLVGRARVVRDRATKNAHWAKAWDTFYADRDTSVVLIAVTAERLEVVCTKLGVEGDSGTWLPPAVTLAPRPAVRRPIRRR